VWQRLARATRLRCGICFSTVEENQRVRVLDRMIELVGLPTGITREGTLRLDQETLDAWKDEMDTVWF